MSGTSLLGGVPPGTAFKRMGTAAGRPGTGAQQALGGATLRTAVPQVENRPITQHGVVGMRAGTSGSGGRRVLDKNFFLTELRQKRMDVANATHKMQVRRAWARRGYKQKTRAGVPIMRILAL